MTSLTVLLPVYNRGNMTASFITHLGELLAKSMSMKVVLFDDGSTDETINLAREVFPGLTLVRLDGKAYWGGAINAISDYMKQNADHTNDNEIYLLANDDIRFPSEHALFAGINAVSRDSFACARSILVPSIEAESIKSIATCNISFGSGVRYHQDKGIFSEATLNSPANVASTWAMLSTREAWGSDLKVPRSIPHYLSDYWFTYNLVKLGFNLRQPHQFTCYASLGSTRNKPTAAKSKCNIIFDRDLVKRYLQATSPEYLPAWIEFLGQEPISSLVKRRLLKLRLKAIILTLLMSCLSIKANLQEFLTKTKHNL